MPEAGETKEKYCDICKQQTTWEYTVIQMPDGVFGLRNLLAPETNQKRFWRCTRHTNWLGNTKSSFKE